MGILQPPDQPKIANQDTAMVAVALPSTAPSSDLERAFLALKGKQPLYDELWDFMDGNHPVAFSNRRLREVFHEDPAAFTENWCGVVICSVTERINLNGWRSTDEAIQELLDYYYEALSLDEEADDLMEAALVCGEAYLIVWPDLLNDEPTAFYNDPRMAHVFYDTENPRRPIMACKWWVDDDGLLRITLYYEDRLEYYVSTTAASNVYTAGSMTPAVPDSAPNPYGMIPVFHFRSTRRPNHSDLTDVIPIQRGVTKLLADMMVASEYQALPQRYVISQADVSGLLQNAPNEIWGLPAGDGTGQATTAGQFEAGDLSVYLTAIDHLATAIASISRTPKHYFFSQGGDPSGEALIAQEAPLNKKAQTRIDRFEPTWRKVGAFILQIKGITYDPMMLEVDFDKPETVQPQTEATILKDQVAAGIPLITALRKMGWSESDIETLKKDQAEASKLQQETMAQAMLDAQRRFDQGNQQSGNNQDNLTSPSSQRTQSRSAAGGSEEGKGSSGKSAAA